MSTVYSRRNLTWVRNGTAWVARHGGAELARVVPDEKHPGMWRVRSPDGRSSDMVNLTRAKDAAASMALAVLNRPTDARNAGGHSTEKGKTKTAVGVPPATGRAPTDALTSNLHARGPEAVSGAEMARPAPEAWEADLRRRSSQKTSVTAEFGEQTDRALGQVLDAPEIVPEAAV